MINLKLVSILRVAIVAGATVAMSATASFAAQQPQSVEGYYSDVKGAYKQAAKMMGRAKTAEKKKQVISLQRTCSTSLGGIKKEIKKKKKGQQANLNKAQKFHASCLGALAKAQ